MNFQKLTLFIFTLLFLIVVVYMVYTNIEFQERDLEAHNYCLSIGYERSNLGFCEKKEDGRSC